MDYANTSIIRLRQILKEELIDYHGKPVILPYDEKFLNSLLFKENSRCKKFSEQLNEVLNRINYSNVNLDGFVAEKFDFSPYYGIRINPQTIYNKNLGGAICEGVSFIGPFDSVNVVGTNFKGSKGAEINPQMVYDKNLSYAICADVRFVGLYVVEPNFSGVNIEGTDFTGSNYEVPIKEENEFREKIKTLLHSNYME